MLTFACVTRMCFLALGSTPKAEHSIGMSICLSFMWPGPILYRVVPKIGMVVSQKLCLRCAVPTMSVIICTEELVRHLMTIRHIFVVIWFKLSNKNGLLPLMSHCQIRRLESQGWAYVSSYCTHASWASYCTITINTKKALLDFWFLLHALFRQCIP